VFGGRSKESALTPRPGRHPAACHRSLPRLDPRAMEIRSATDECVGLAGRSARLEVRRTTHVAPVIRIHAGRVNTNEDSLFADQRVFQSPPAGRRVRGGAARALSQLESKQSTSTRLECPSVRWSSRDKSHPHSAKPLWRHRRSMQRDSSHGLPRTYCANTKRFWPDAGG